MSTFNGEKPLRLTSTTGQGKRSTGLVLCHSGRQTNHLGFTEDTVGTMGIFCGDTERREAVLTSVTRRTLIFNILDDRPTYFYFKRNFYWYGQDVNTVFTSRLFYLRDNQPPIQRTRPISSQPPSFRVIWSGVQQDPELRLRTDLLRRIFAMLFARPHPGF